MLGIYRESLSKIQSRKTEKSRKKDERFTGHDKYIGKKSGFKKRRKCGVRESKSATEISKKAVHGSQFRSASYDQVLDVGRKGRESPNEKMPLLGTKMESLAKLFSCVVLAGEREESPNFRQNNGSYAYTALEPAPLVHERLELETKACERAHSICSYYLKSNPRYTLVDQLNDIGSRVGKHWFIVRDSSVKTERLLTLMPKGSKCPIPCDPEIRSVILDLFLALQHPYIYPILDINFREFGGETFIFTTLPLNEKGSLKDFIYKSQWQENWGQKYLQKSNGLPISQVQRLGRQILEALLFLREKGFPPCGHFHSGNIVLQNGVARITGLENALFGLNSRIYPVLLPRAHSDPEGIDVLCFGHVLFEMCAGYELDTSQPSPGNMLDIHHYPQVIEVLEFIFEHPDMRLPIIEELLLCDLFRNIDLREIRNQAQSTKFFKMNLTTKAIELLSEVKKLQSGKRRLRLQSSLEGDLQKDKSTSSAGSEDEVEDGDYDADTNSESESSRKKEHRCLGLHSNSTNRILISVRRNCDD